MISRQELAKELGVSSTRISQLFRKLGIEPVQREGKHWLTEGDYRRLMLYRKRPRQRGMVSLLRLCTLLQVHEEIIERYCSHLGIQPVEINGAGFVRLADSRQIRHAHRTQSLPLSRAEFEVLSMKLDLLIGMVEEARNRPR